MNTQIAITDDIVVDFSALFEGGGPVPSAPPVNLAPMIQPRQVVHPTPSEPPVIDSDPPAPSADEVEHQAEATAEEAGFDKPETEEAEKASPDKPGTEAGNTGKKKEHRERKRQAPQPPLQDKWTARRWDCECKAPQHQMRLEREIINKGLDFMKRWFEINAYEDVWEKAICEIEKDFLEAYSRRSDIAIKLAADVALACVDYLELRCFGRSRNAHFLKHKLGEELKTRVRELKGRLDNPLG